MPIQIDRRERPPYDERGCLNHETWLPAVFKDVLMYTPTFNTTIDCVASVDKAAKDTHARILASQEDRGGDNAIFAFVEAEMDD